MASYIVQIDASRRDTLIEPIQKRQGRISTVLIYDFVDKVKADPLA